MKIKTLDHFVLTVKDIQKSVNFYSSVLDMEVKLMNGEYSLHYGSQKINLHHKLGIFTPEAQHPTSGSADVCFELDNELRIPAKEKMKEVYNYLIKKGIKIVEGPVDRIGAKGKMISLYIRDPDGNLIELSTYYMNNI